MYFVISVLSALKLVTLSRRHVIVLTVISLYPYRKNKRNAASVTSTFKPVPVTKGKI